MADPEKWVGQFFYLIVVFVVGVALLQALTGGNVSRVVEIFSEWVGVIVVGLLIIYVILSILES